MTKLKVSSVFVMSLVLGLLMPAVVLAQHGMRIGGQRGTGFCGAFGGGHAGVGFNVTLRGCPVGFRNGPFIHRPFVARPFLPRQPFFSRPRVFIGDPFGFYGSYGYSPFYDYGFLNYDYSPYYPNYPTVMLERGVPPYRETDRGASVGRHWPIALKNNTVIAVTDYWLEGSKLHYVTRQGTKGGGGTGEGRPRLHSGPEPRVRDRVSAAPTAGGVSAAAT